MLTSGEISEAFDAWKLEEPQLLLIHEYFHKNHIGIDEPGMPRKICRGTT